MRHQPSPLASPGIRRLVIIGLCSFVSIFTLAPLVRANDDTGKKSFNIPADSAERTLKSFSDQSGRGVVYVEDAVKGVQTNAVEGQFTPAEALDMLVKGTGLVVSYDATSGAFAVRKADPDPNAQRAAFANDRPIQDPVASASSGSISGSVKRPAGGPSIQGLTVTVIETGQTTGTDSYGRFIFDSIAPGTYTLEVKASDGRYQPLRITQVVVQSGAQNALAGETVSQSTSGEVKGMSESDFVELEKYMVTDKKPYTNQNMDIIRTMDDPQPYYIYDNQQIAQSGAVSVEDFFTQQLPMDTVYAPYDQTINSSNGPVSHINLGGIGADETLILIDGRRAAPTFAIGSTVFQADLNAIPIFAIDRIEVLPASSSAVYGGDAMGGVVNVILKHNYEGVSADVTYGTDFSANVPQHVADVAYGLTLEGGKTNIMITASYSDRATPVEQQDTIIGDHIADIYHNDPSFIYSATSNTLGTTPNIRNNTTAALILKNGTSIGSAITYIPVGTSPTTPTATLNAGLTANAGTENTVFPNIVADYDYIGQQNDVGAPFHKRAVLVNFRRDMTPHLHIFIEGNYLDSLSDATENAFSANGMVVPASAPDNPFTAEVHVTIPTGLVNPYDQQVQERTAVFGFTYDLPNDWTLESDYTLASTVTSYEIGTYLSTTVTNDLASGVLNPFVDTLANPLNLAPYYDYVQNTEPASFNDFSIRANGPLWKLPAGQPRLTLGLEHRLEGIGNANRYATYPANSFYTTDEIYLGQDETVNSAYAEAAVPLVAPKNGIFGINRLDLQAAVRDESYSIGAGTVEVFMPDGQNDQASNPPLTHYNEKFNEIKGLVGAKYSPVSSVTLRASIANAFEPPAFSELVPNTLPVGTTPATTSVVDPLRGNTTESGIQYASGGNPTLKPTVSNELNLGIVFEPDFIKGLRIDVEHYYLEQTDTFVDPTTQAVVNYVADGLLPSSYVTRGPLSASDIAAGYKGGPITYIQEEYENANQFLTSGYNFTLDYRTPSTRLGTFNLHLLTTTLEHYKFEQSLNGPLVDLANRPAAGGYLKSRGSAAIGWQRKGWNAQWTAWWIGSYPQLGADGDPTTSATVYTLAQGGPRIPTQIYNNLLVGYTFKHSPPGPGWGEMLSDLSIRVGIQNVLNAAPPLDVEDQYFTAYSGSVATAQRSYWINVAKKF